MFYQNHATLWKGGGRTQCKHMVSIEVIREHGEGDG